jgi:nickel transport protein
MMRLPAVLLVLALSAGPALAHKLKLFAQAEGMDLVGTAYFAGGGKAAGLDGRVAAADGSPVATFRTDADGAFRVAAGRRQDHLLTVDSADGHAATARVAAADLPDTLPSGGMVSPAGDAVLDAALARQLRPLREQIDALENRTRLGDVIGGIGFIFGLFGIAAWMAARKEKRG